MAGTANTRASAANIAALIDKAQKLHNQADVMVRQAQEQCKHESADINNVYNACPDCGRRWFE